MHAFLIAMILAAGVPGNVSGPVQSAETANALAPVTTINAICASPTAGCSAGQWVTMKVGGRNSFSGTITPATFTGTFACYFSKDNGANYVQGLIKSTTTTEYPTSAYATSVPFAASSAVTFYSCLSVIGGATDVALISTAAVTNTATANMVGSMTAPHLVEAALSIKGTQSNLALYVPTQDAKDAGRSYVALGADGVTPAIAETLITFTKTVADTQTAAQTSYTITNLKTLRIQAVCTSMTAGAAANRIRVALRLNTGGACTAASNVLLPVAELAPNYGTATAAEGGAFVCQPIPDGLEILGNGTKAICLTENATAASGTLTVNLVAYEY